LIGEEKTGGRRERTGVRERLSIAICSFDLAEQGGERREGTRRRRCGRDLKGLEGRGEEGRNEGEGGYA